ncbi:MAG TPA: alpha-L-arabinofuranosidase C-terminal domain-containing protein [Prolixibacteraceae bacterium]|nr:alpha-L-arabinofuranosidase C-terminal domain-containing protein [Prolixibacteraceae bacterium]
MEKLSFFIILVLVTLTMKAQVNVLKIDAAGGKNKINKNIYGQFAEHLGRCIYDGIWVGKNSPIPNVNGYRKDLLEALQALKIPVLRWPGGCFADTYHWKSGIGPVNERPKIKNVFWGGTVEDNSFGTHEFLNLCEMLGCDAYISANVGSGSVGEMVEWIEYMTSDDDIPMANLRRKNGREKPWNVKFMGIGNESWGCGGNMTVDYYVNLMKQYSGYVNVYNKDVFRVGSGANGDDANWTKVMMERGAANMDGLSVHYYTIAGPNWDTKTSATNFGEELYFSGLKKALFMDELVTRHSAIMDQYDKSKRVGLMVDEWGIWTDQEPGSTPGHLFQQNSMRDALIASVTLDIFNKHCERVKMANIAQIVNVLQSMILTKGDKMILTPSYYVFKMYNVHQDATLLPTSLITEQYKHGEEEIPALSSSASVDKNGKIHVTISNLNPVNEEKLEINVAGKSFGKINSATVLTAPTFNAVNTFEKPDVIVPVALKNVKKLADNKLELSIPGKSVVVLELE